MRDAHISANLTQSNNQSGNVFFALFGAVALVGVLGAATMTIMRGPVTGMQKVTKYTVAENAMIAAGRLSIVTGGEDCDNDSVMEPLEWDDPGAAPTPSGGGHLPTTIGAARQDPWGNIYGYCVWDHGAEVDNAGCGGPTQNRLAGDSDIETEAGGIVIAIISSGPDRIFQTTCEDHPDYVTKGGDDVALLYTYGEAKTLAAGLWKAKGDEGAEIARDLEVYSSANPTQQIFGLDSQTDPSKPSIKVDFISKLNPAALGVTFLSNVLVDGGSVGIGSTAAPQAALDITAAGEGASILRFNTDRAWRFEQSGAGGTAALDLRAEVGGKRFNIKASDGTQAASFLTSTGAHRVNLVPEGGRVGIGNVAAPLSILHIRQESDNEGDGIRINNSANTDTFNIRIASNSRTHIGGGASPSAMVLKHTTGGVGIGTDDPQTPLHVMGGARFQAGSYANGAYTEYLNTSNSNTTPSQVGQRAYPGRIGIGIGQGGSDTLYVQTSNGAVGIGMDNPSNPLHVRTSGPTIATFERTATNNTGIEYKNSTASMYAGLAGNAIGWGISGSADIGANPSFIVRRDTGNVGIGTSAPAYTTEIAGSLGVLGGSVRFDRGGNYDIWLQGGSASSGEARNLALLGHTSTDRLYVNYGSEYTAGTLIGGPVSVSGDLNVSGNISGGGLGDNLGNHTATQALNMGSNKITNLATPTANADGATKLYVDQRAALAADNLGSGGTTTGTLYSNGGTYGYLGLDSGNYWRFNDERALLRLGAAWVYDFGPTYFRPYVNDTSDLGTSGNRWRNIYASADIYAKGVDSDYFTSRRVMTVSSNNSSDEAAMQIRATQTNQYGIHARAQASGSNAIYAVAESNAGWTIYSRTEASAGRAVWGYATSSSGANYGIRGDTNSTAGRGVYGYASSATGTSFGVYGVADSTGGRGVWCDAPNNAGGCGGTRAWSNVSDIRLKKDIHDLPQHDGLDAIMKLRPVVYKWRTDKTQKQEMGFIAQEVEETLPLLVTSGVDTTVTKDDGTKEEIKNVKALTYANFTVPLVKAVQDIKALIDGLTEKVSELFSMIGALQQENAALKERVDTLEKRLEALEAKQE